MFRNSCCLCCPVRTWNESCFYWTLPIFALMPQLRGVKTSRLCKSFQQNITHW